MWQEKDCPLVILMSATLNEDSLMHYYQCPPENFISVKGFSYPIQDHFSKVDLTNYIEYTCNTIKQICESESEKQLSENNDIIIFVASKKDAKPIVKYITDYNTEISSTVQKRYLLPIFINRGSYQSGDLEYKNLFSNIRYTRVEVDGKKRVPYKRVVIATALAETGLTLPTLQYCIDTGWNISIEFLAENNATAILTKTVTRGISTQRRGRVGRKAPGIFHACYTRETYDNLPQDQLSQVLLTDMSSQFLALFANDCEVQLVPTNKTTMAENNATSLENVIPFVRHYIDDPELLNIFNAKPFEIKNLDFIDMPPASSIIYSMEKLHKLGFITQDYTITLFGYLARGFQKISLELIRVIFAGYCHGADILSLITIAAFIVVGKTAVCSKKYQYRNIYRSKNQDEIDFYAGIIFADDFVDMIFLYEEFIKIIKCADIVKILAWCNESGIFYEKMLAVVSMRDEIIGNLIGQGLNPYQNGLGIDLFNLTDITKQNLAEGVEEIKKIKRCLLDGFRLNLLQYNTKSNTYVMHSNNQSVSVKSKLTRTNKPQYILTSGVILSKSMSGRYEFSSGDFISVLDCSVDIDLTFM